MEPPAPEPKGFQMSGKRTWVELGIVAGVVVVGLGLLIGLARALGGYALNLVPTDVDRTIGERAWALPGPAHCQGPAERYVKELAAPLVAALGPTPFEFQFRVVDDPAVNAFALPGGFVTVNMGLLEKAETGGEVAAVIAHELVHVLERHGTRRVLRAIGGTTVLYLLVGGTDMAAPATLVADLAASAYDRDQERDADQKGQAIMERAGFDPTAMARFFERMAKDSITPPEWLSTHPDPGDRAELAAKRVAQRPTTRVVPSPRGLSCRRSER